MLCMSSHSFLILCLIVNWGIEISFIVELSFSLLNYVSFFMFSCYDVKCMCLCYISQMDSPFYHYEIPLFISSNIFFVLNSILPDTRVVTPAFLWVLFS